MKKKIYQTPETEILELGVESPILGTSDFDPQAPVIINPSQPTDPTNPPAPI